MKYFSINQKFTRFSNLYMIEFGLNQKQRSTLNFGDFGFKFKHATKYLWSPPHILSM